MRLFTFWRSSSAYRVRIALAMKGLAYEPAFVHLTREGGAQNTADFRAKNPLGQIPVLEIDREGDAGPVFLSQSLAIIEYLEERYPTPPLLPKDLLARARVRELAQLINSGIQPFQNLTTTKFLTEAAPGLDKQQWFEAFIAGGLRVLEGRAQQLSGRYWVGDAVSIADVLLVPQLNAARRLNLSFDGYPTLLRIEAECLKLEGFASAHPDRQPDRE
ncbi:MAG TPA: maleylacetoacetate isomerase [Polyangiaceae bacterium]|nr:maleylacetoacetate isomerase [Polyangiaceae bacterium]